jgi:proline iminopeptidase
VEDIEKLRTQVAQVDKWQAFGGSWGSTLALAYGVTYPQRVTELVLRGIFLFDQYEIDWMYTEGGASQVYPDKFDEFLAPIPQAERGDLVEAYRKRLTSDDKAEQLAAAKAWSKWEGDIVTLLPSPSTIEHFTAPDVAVAVARIENHYMANHGWLDEGQLLRDADKLKGIPGVIVQGRHDTCTPPVAAWKLKQEWPEVELNIIPDAGHLFNEPGNLDALVRATDKFAGL